MTSSVSNVRTSQRSCWERRLFQSGDALTTSLLFLDSSDLELLLVEVQVGPHLLDSLVGDGKAKLLFSNGKVQPELSPSPETSLWKIR